MIAHGDTITTDKLYGQQYYVSRVEGSTYYGQNIGTDFKEVIIPPGDYMVVPFFIGEFDIEICTPFPTEVFPINKYINTEVK